MRIRTRFESFSSGAWFSEWSWVIISFSKNIIWYFVKYYVKLYSRSLSIRSCDHEGPICKTARHNFSSVVFFIDTYMNRTSSLLSVISRYTWREYLTRWVKKRLIRNLTKIIREKWYQVLRKDLTIRGSQMILLEDVFQTGKSNSRRVSSKSFVERVSLNQEFHRMSQRFRIYRTFRTWRQRRTHTCCVRLFLYPPDSCLQKCTRRIFLKV